MWYSGKSVTIDPTAIPVCSHIMAAVPLLIQLPDNAVAKATEEGPSVWALLPRWEIWNKVPSPDFSVAQSWPLQSSRE